MKHLAAVGGAVEKAVEGLSRAPSNVTVSQSVAFDPLEFQLTRKSLKIRTQLPHSERGEEL